MARTTDPTITVVVDPDDDIACLEQLRRLHARPYGQILCEPDPTATSAELARYILESLGKQSSHSTRGQLWAQVDCHLTAERVHDLAVTRAHALTYAALRDLTDHAHNAGTSIWLLIAAERLTAAIAQLLEAQPYERCGIDGLIARWQSTAPPREPESVPPGAGIDYPYLTPRSPEKVLTRAKLSAGLQRADRRAVSNIWNQSHQWMTTWIDEHPNCPASELVTALYRLAWAGDTGSELLVRAQAAITAAHDAGIAVNHNALARDLTLRFGETRPYQWRPTVELAAALADQASDPWLGALIALSAVYPYPTTVRRATLRGIATDGSIAAIDWGGLRAIPPPLRKALAAQRRRLLDIGASNDALLLPGTHGRISTTTIENALARLDAPRSLWDQPAREHFEGPELDGRTILGHLNPIELFDPARQ